MFEEFFDDPRHTSKLRPGDGNNATGCSAIAATLPLVLKYQRREKYRTPTLISPNAEIQYF
jgi:hypothetical protein